MKIHFLGANRQVTGSKYCLEVGTDRILIDAGMFQERSFEQRNWDPCCIEPAKVKAVLLTHAHLDHSGLLPRLVKQGLQCPIYCTEPTAPLSEVVLRDSAEIQLEDLSYKQRRLAREHREPRYAPEPLYIVEDVARLLPLFAPVKYGQEIAATPHIRARFVDAGHILGSASIEVTATEEGVTRTILFSGDIGQANKPILNDPSLPTRTFDYVIMESTYGDREHELDRDVESQLADIVNDAVSTGGKVLIPTFAIERAQELIYHFSRLHHAGRIPHVPMYLDSPMALDVTDIYSRFRGYFDEESWQMIREHGTTMMYPGLTFVRSVEASKAINNVQGPAVIMASSGMCTAGRIKHHLKNHIEKPNTTILFVGFQAPGTLGRQIRDGARTVRIHGGVSTVRAKIAQIYGFSGHADRNGLMTWLRSVPQPPRQVFLTHGEEDVALLLRQRIRTELGWPCDVPQYNEGIDLG